jgi:hypothetical protein
MVFCSIYHDAILLSIHSGIRKDPIPNAPFYTILPKRFVCYNEAS